MAENLNIKKVILLATGQEKLVHYFREQIQSHLGKSTIYLAPDGLDALMKLSNDPPHVFSLTAKSPKKLQLNW